MKFERIYCQKPNKLIGSFVEVHIEENDLPLTADLLPTAQSHIIYFFSVLDTWAMVQSGSDNNVTDKVSLHKDLKSRFLLGKSKQPFLPLRLYVNIFVHAFSILKYQ